MAEKNVITSMLDDLSKEQPIQTAVCIGQNLSKDHAQDHHRDHIQQGVENNLQNHDDSIQWDHFNVTTFLNLPFTKRYDLGFVILNGVELDEIQASHKTQLLVKLRDLMAKRIVVVSRLDDEQLLRSLGFTQLIDKTTHDQDFALWQFNILTYKHVPDWFNSKFWANPENWNKFRW
ncbi:DUF6231 family protein [Acinetobacter shaoyimingii]|uniref:Uncharacterized protein n=1 Tax=Acinetobacter shaoyimingii TaxID=2715164 RepID=A0A6G8RUX5_9GAMM|nr:DUF6231 family protein [Acinetobacter shaoyimingii]NHB58630.1 hypothetical protein [Acinetobacter shaoyimingii]QIO05736.1 hypothetical protein G8E00_07105 [Acinetobacter shaoyimingii]